MSGTAERAIRHLSPSKVQEGVERCMLRLKYRHVDRIPAPVGGMMIAGRAVHAAIECALKEKMAGRPAPSAKDLDDRLMEKWRKEQEKEEDGPGIDWGEKEGDSRERMEREHRAMVPLVLERIVPAFEPQLVEHTFKEEMDAGEGYGEFLMWSVVDLVQADDRVVDWKTTRKVSQNARKLDLQMAAYGWNARVWKGIERPKVSKVFLVRGRTPKLDRQDYDVEPRHMDFFERASVEVWRATVDGNYVPNISSFWCSPKFCPFYGPCRGGM